MAAWMIWVIAAVALGIAEVLTLTFVLGLTAFAAVGGAIAAAAGASAAVQWIVFGAADVVLLGSVLPVARRHLRTPPSIRSGTERLVGKRVMSISPISTASGGQVRINGEAWSARPDIDGYVIPPGQWVNVVRIDGATAVVHPTTEPVS
ncbi:MAG TPA: NfeD family protein [Mycobacteriales bacterium]|nr:NfeD family protein [Mycobacteriales bacterium]